MQIDFEQEKDGSGWTNSVFAALLARVILGSEYDLTSGRSRWKPSLPDEWRGKEVHVHLPHYPWPNGISR